MLLLPLLLRRQRQLLVALQLPLLLPTLPWGGAVITAGGEDKVGELLNLAFSQTWVRGGHIITAAASVAAGGEDKEGQLLNLTLSQAWGRDGGERVDV